MKNKIPLVVISVLLLIAVFTLVKAQTPGEQLIVDALLNIATALEPLESAQACKAESTTVSKGVSFTAADPDKATAEKNARKGVVDKAWQQADDKCKEMDKADGATQCHVKKGELDRDKDINVNCVPTGNVFACDAKLNRDVTYICNT